MNPVRVVLVDDQELFREALGTLLSVERSIQLVGQAPDGAAAWEAVRQLRPDVVLMDLRMPGISGVEAIRRIRHDFPDTKILVLTTFGEDVEVFTAIQAGAEGYLLKACPSAKLVEAVLAVASGQSVLHPTVAVKLLKEYKRLAKRELIQQVRPLEQPLSRREIEVLVALAGGRSNKEIAADLGISEGTVKNHMTNVFGKLGVSDRTQAALRAREMGLI